MTVDAGVVSEKLSAGIRLRLSLMMFLQFFVWGAWFVTMGTFLGESLSASGSQISLAYLTQSLGAILAPLIIGLIADQFFSAQKILGVLHIAGALLLWIAGDASEFGRFFPLILGYMILYMPTLALVNSGVVSPDARSRAAVPGRAGPGHHWVDRRRSDHRLAGLGARTAGPDLQDVGGGLADLGYLQLHASRYAAHCARGEVQPARHAGLGGPRPAQVTLIPGLLSMPRSLSAFRSPSTTTSPTCSSTRWASTRPLPSSPSVRFRGGLPPGAALPAETARVKRTLALGMAAWALRYVCFAFGDSGGHLLVVDRRPCAARHLLRLLLRRRTDLHQPVRR